jgi:hypothetical protein
MKGSVFSISRREEGGTMDPAMRRAWTEIVTADDYDLHMAAIGQAQAAAELTAQLVGAAALPSGSRVTIAGAGTGQMLDFLEPWVLRPFRLTFSDLNPTFLDRLRQRLAAHRLNGEIVVDDVETTRLAAEPDLLLAALLLEQIDWRVGVESLVRLRPGACGIILQENPPEMVTAVTPGRKVPPSIAEASQNLHSTLVPRSALVDTMAAKDYPLRLTASRAVADRKRLIGLLFRRAGR